MLRSCHFVRESLAQLVLVFVCHTAWGMDQEIPDYDMDSEDEHWLNKQTKKMEVSPLKFENMMDRLEKGSGQTVSTRQSCHEWH